MKTKITLFSVLTILAASVSAPAIARAQYDELASTAPIPPKLKLEQLPQAAQDTIREEAAGRKIAQIDRESWNGQSGYRVEFTEQGRNPDVYVSDEGKVLRPAEKPSGMKSLFFGTKFENTPTVVQDTLRREIGTGEITKISRDGKKGAYTYKITARDPQSSPYELQLSEEGKILNDSRSASRIMNK